MPLPKIEVPKYVLKIPSTNKKVQFRPFLVKEEKVLMIAQESEDESQIESAIKDVISSCTFDKVNPNDLTTYDLEYIFLQLRSKSIGETATFNLKCEECGEYTEVSIDLGKVNVSFPEDPPEENIKLNDTIGMILKPVSVKNMGKANHKDFNSMISLVIDAIYSDNVYSANDVSKAELDEFIDNLAHSSLQKIQQFIENQPSLKHIVKFKCGSCGAENEVVLEGLSSFF